jgi:hypothetical protein
MSTDSLLVYALLYGIVPAWLAFGLADWWCHRRARIELNAGPRESLLHIAQLATVGLPLLAMLFLQVNAAIMLFMMAGLVLHTVAAAADIAYADAVRHIAPREQHVHGALGALPVAATFIVIVLHWQEFRALWSAAPASFALALKQPPLPTWYLAAVLAGVGLFGVLPYAEELLRTLRFRRGMPALKGSVVRMD